MALLLLWALENYNDIEPIILSPDTTDEISIRDIMILIVKYMKFKGNIIFDTIKANGQYKKTASNTKLRHLLPNFQFTTLENGLKATIDWFIDNYKTVRR